jgi:hypothetical protein
MCLLCGTNWIVIYQRMTFFIVPAVKNSKLKGLFLREKIILFHLVLKLKMHGVIPPLAIHFHAMMRDGASAAVSLQSTSCSLHSRSVNCWAAGLASETARNATGRVQWQYYCVKAGEGRRSLATSNSATQTYWSHTHTSARLTHGASSHFVPWSQKGIDSVP